MTSKDEKADELTRVAAKFGYLESFRAYKPTTFDGQWELQLELVLVDEVPWPKKKLRVSVERAIAVQIGNLNPATRVQLVAKNIFDDGMEFCTYSFSDDEGGLVSFIGKDFAFEIVDAQRGPRNHTACHGPQERAIQLI